MKLYQLLNTDPNKPIHDVYESFVATAENQELAKDIHPLEENDWNKEEAWRVNNLYPHRTWPTRGSEYIECILLSDSSIINESKIVCSNFIHA